MTQWLLWLKQQLCTCYLLVRSFLCRPCTTTIWNEEILSWLEKGSGEERAPLSSVPTKLLYCKVTEWLGIREKKFERMCIFQRRFHWCRRRRIVRSLLYTGVNPRGGAGENTQESLYGKAPPQGPSPYPNAFIHIYQFWQKMYPFRV